MDITMAVIIAEVFMLIAIVGSIKCQVPSNTRSVTRPFGCATVRREELTLLSYLTILGVVTARIFNRCEFGYELVEKGIQPSDWTLDIPKWICLGDHTTGYNSSFYVEEANLRSYGSLRISNEWCEDSHPNSRNRCNVPCADLLSDDITETVRCANQIFTASGNSFNWWSPYWVNNCRDFDSTPYIRGCEANIGIRPVVVLKEDDIDVVVGCRVRGYPRVTNMSWEWDTMENDTDISQEFNPIPVDIDYYNNLTFSRVRLNHTKQYTCHAVNDRESLGTAFEIVVVQEEVTDLPSTMDVTSEATSEATYAGSDPSITDATTDPIITGRTTYSSTPYTTTDQSNTLTTVDSSPVYITTDETYTITTMDTTGTMELSTITDSSTDPSYTDKTVEPSTPDGIDYSTTTDAIIDSTTKHSSEDTTSGDGSSEPTTTYLTTDFNLSTTDGFTQPVTWSNTTGDSLTIHTDTTVIATKLPTTTVSQTSSTSRPHPSTFPPDDGTTYEFCDLARKLTYIFNDSIEWNETLHTWMCLSEAATQFNASYIELDYTGDPPIIYYGLFKISNRYCQDIFDAGNPCKVKCEELAGMNLHANTMCATHVYETNGFVNWPEYEYCAEYSPDNLIRCQEPPVFLSTEGIESNLYFHEYEEDQSITCSVRGYPPPELKWDDGTLDYIKQSAGRVILDQRGPIKETLNNGSWVVKYTLLFTTILDSDERTYFCNATNTAASATQTIIVKVLDPTWLRPLVIAGGCFVFLLGLLALVLGYRRYRKQKKKHENLLNIYRQFKYGNQTGPSKGRDGIRLEYTAPNYFYTPAEFQMYQSVMDLPLPTTLHISPHELIVLRSIVLGVGAFGIVFKGILGEKKEVAVKTLVNGADEEKLACLLSEVKIMSHVGDHANIVQLLGVEMSNLRRGNVHVALEYCSRGSLKDILQQRRKDLETTTHPCNNYSLEGYLNPKTLSDAVAISEFQLLAFCIDVCAAMEFLTEKKIIHGDLAARNVLVDANLVAKISDFGLSRQMSDTYKKYIVAPKETSLPWRWLAIETLRHLKFSSASDVWAFGVFMWEVFTLAELPYGTSINFSPDFVNYLEVGFRLQIPKFATEEIHELMKRCWEKETVDRINFQEMNEQLVCLRQVESETNKNVFRRRGYHLQGTGSTDI